MDDQTHFEQLAAAVDAVKLSKPMGLVEAVDGGVVEVRGFGRAVRLGDRLTLQGRQGRRLGGEVVALRPEYAKVLVEGPVSGLTIGDRAILEGSLALSPHDSWIGRVVSPDGRPLDGRPLLPGLEERQIDAPPPEAAARRSFGERLGTGLAAFDTLLPLVRGQRIGLFAGSGVGKSTLLGSLCRSVDADVVVVALVGERGRELRDFVSDVLGEEGMRRAVVVAATSDTAPQVRRRCAPSAMAVAEYFRDQGKNVLMLVDSVTRMAEAHREVALAGGESPALSGFPASTARLLAGLCERAGPGVLGQGDITAVFSVLVAGSDMEEPIADILRGILDGHVVLDREIAERGRYPAINLLRSVSRSLPGAATAEENSLIADARSVLGTYEKAELMIQAGLYDSGSDPKIDRAIAVWPGLDRFLSEKSPSSPEAAFRELAARLSFPKRPTPDAGAMRPGPG